MIIEFKGVSESKDLRHEIEEKLTELSQKVPSVDLEHAHAVVGLEHKKKKIDKNYFRFLLILPRIGETALRLERKAASLEEAIKNVFEGMLGRLLRGKSRFDFKPLPRMARYKRLSKGKW